MAIRHHSLEVEGGIQVLSVESGGPAERSGIMSGDVIVGLNGAAVAGIDDLHRLLPADAIGAAMPVVIVRRTEKRELTIVPDES